jgi:hypothetical protein
MRVAFDLYETAEATMRQNLKRRHPQATEVEIERLRLAAQAAGPASRPSLPEIRVHRVTRLVKALVREMKRNVSH